MQQDGPVGGALRQTGFAYDAAGRLATLYRPNYYAPPEGSTAAAWIESLTCDVLGRLVSRQAADSGTTRSMYDSASRLRFVLDAAGAALNPPNPQRILYVRYDDLDRQTEIGFIQDARYAWVARCRTRPTSPSSPTSSPPRPARTTPPEPGVTASPTTAMGLSSPASSSAGSRASRSIRTPAP